ncbi:DinB/UmuC family translesion DNA polymerase, partial [Escherichia coli]|uniref:DinB/UmuC family translesion DNA polymerase n=1 Tax=Escherichia coli TaxID=562 RepID=UPI00215A2E46
RQIAAAHEALAVLADKVWRHAASAARRGRTVTLKVKYGDFRQITRARPLPRPVESRDEMLEMACELLAPVFADPHGVRLLGITLSG